MVNKANINLHTTDPLKSLHLCFSKLCFFVKELFHFGCIEISIQLCLLWKMKENSVSINKTRCRLVLLKLIFQTSDNFIFFLSFESRCGVKSVQILILKQRINQSFKHSKHSSPFLSLWLIFSYFVNNITCLLLFKEPFWP